MPIEIIDDAGAMETIADAWDDLWRRAPGASPFQSPHWLLPWWKRFGSDTPFVVIDRNERLEALAPLYILRDDDTGESLGMLLGTGVTDYLDVLVARPESAGPLRNAIAGADCQLWDFQQLRPSSPLLVAPLADGWTCSVEAQDPCPILPLAAAGTGLEGLLSTHARKKLRYSRRCAEREGAVSYETATASSLPTMLDSLFELHEARWRRRGLPGVLGDGIIQDFHRDVTARTLAAGALRLHAMRIGERTAAVFYGFAHQGTVYYYLSGYDPQYERFGIGNLIVAHAIEQALAEGATVFDFLRGAEEYKYAWGATDRMNSHAVWMRTGE